MNNKKKSYLCKVTTSGEKTIVFCPVIEIMMHKKVKNIFCAVVLAALAAVSCDKLDDDFKIKVNNPSQNAGTRMPGKSNGSVRAHLMVSFGFNSLSSYLVEDIKDLEDGFIPGNGAQDNLLFVFSHSAQGSYSQPTSPVLTRLYKGANGQIFKQKLLELPSGEIPNSKENLALIFKYIQDRYHPDELGVLMSSHGTGWTPPGYCSKPASFEKESEWLSPTLFSVPRWGESFVPERDFEVFPLTKSFGETKIASNPGTSYETDIKELAESIPYKLDYLILDACFMGGVEVAYELRDKCRFLCFSQTEILADGMNYKTMMSHLLEKKEADVISLGNEFYDYYNKQSGYNRSATISVIDCSKMDPLVEVCEDFFSRHDIDSKNCASDELQPYFRSQYAKNHGWFYDLRSIFVAAGADEEELKLLDAALAQSVVYNEATEYFMEGYGGFRVKYHCGFSMYLPYPEKKYLNNYYKTLAWNEATGLIK